MITPQECEAFANETLKQYILDCGCETRQDVANVCMKLAGMCGLAMCESVGQEEAIQRMESVLIHVSKPEYGVPSNPPKFIFRNEH